MSKLLHVSDAQVDRWAHVVDTAGAVEVLEEALDLAPQGRPRALTLRTWLIGALLAIDAGASFKATTIHRALTGMSAAKQWELGVRYRAPDGTTKTVTKYRCDYLAKTISKRLADTPAAAAHWELELDAEELDRRRQLRETALDELLDASKVTQHDGWFAADGTSTWSWGVYNHELRAPVDIREHEEVGGRRETTEELLARVADDVIDAADEATATSAAGEGTGCDETDSAADATDEPNEDDEGDDDAGDTLKARRKERRRRGGSSDYDAGLGKKTARMGPRETYFGYVIDAMVRVAAPGEPTVPMVIERLLISPASTDVVEPTLAMIDSLTASGVTVTDLCVDRHYNFKKVERWADQLRARGINQHFDLRSDDHGFRDVNGMRMVDGWMHCPATPDEFGEILRPAPNASAADKAEFRRKIEARFDWAMDRDERPNAKGRARFVCPAVAGKVGCPLRPDTVDDAKYFGLPIVSDPPEADTAPKCCTNVSGKATAREPLLRKHDQPYYWGSSDWEQAYNRRVYVEGVFGSIKSSDTEGLSRGFTRYVGIPMVSLGITLAAVVANVRHQRKHWDGCDDAPDHPLLAPEPENHGWKALTAEEAAVLDRFHGRPPRPAA